MVGTRWDLARLQDTPHPLLLTPATQATQSQPLSPAGNALTRVKDEPTALLRPRGVAWQLIREHGTPPALIGFPDYAPKQLNFGSLWDRQRSRLRVHVTAMADGPITAALPEGGPFRIVSMAAYDGPWDGSGAGGTAPTREQLLTAARHVSASRVSPPWTLNAQAGQDVEIAIEAYFDLLKTGVGGYDAILQIAGNASAAPNAGTTTPQPPPAEPAIVSFQPQSTGVGPDARIRVGFDQAMNQAATQAAFWVRPTGSSVMLPGTCAWVGNEMQFAPAAALAPLTTYQAVLNTAAKSATGVGLGHAFVWTFTTRAAGTPAPALPPAITMCQPQGSGVAPGAQIRLAFNQAMDKPATQAAFWVREEGTTGSPPTTGTFAWVGNEMQFTPAAPLTAPKTYRTGLSATARTAAGVALGAAFSLVVPTRPRDPPPMAGPANPALPPRWAIKLPVHGQFEGLNLGVLFTTDHPDTDLVADAAALAPGEPHRFDVAVKLTNTNAAASGEIRAESLPPGVSMAPASADVPKDATVAPTLHFAIDAQATEGIYTAPHEVPYAIVLRYDANGRTSWLNLNLTLHDCFRVWRLDRWKEGVGGVSIIAAYLVRSNGASCISYIGENDNFQNMRKLIEVWVTQDPSVSFPLCTAEPTHENGGEFQKETSLPVMNFRTPDDYLKFVSQPITLHIKVSSN